MNRILFSLCLLPSFLIGGPVLQVRNFDDLPQVFAKLNPIRTFVFLDVDDLAIIPNSSLGSVAWFKELKNLLVEYKVPEEQADRIRSDIWDFGLRHTSFSSPSEPLMETLGYLRSREFSVLGVTRRSIAFANVLPEHLRSLGCDFVSFLPSFLRISHLLSPRDPRAIWTQGLLFAGSLPISEALEKFVANVSIPLNSTVCISFDREFLNECHSYFSKKKSSSISVMLTPENAQNVSIENAEMQILSLNLSSTDAETHRPQPLSGISYTREDVLRKMRDIWSLCSG
ncbi:DUF2608 domain-containing protein [Candidatus Similichlamydia epinepheli]|uniref:DUF2608 domain-containing protein n=1 Tax=Candidatus Similichlamydia epinepheli TaxID=1903953 RepID=UPI001300B7F8|nr:DUF2608 domain-containing protein [Candidatus Similichlamydia epinepheli]